MKFVKKGLIFSITQKSWWMDNSTLTPTPFLLNEKTLRIYCSIRDAEGMGRIGYVDVEANNPSKILKVSSEPVLDIGKPGCFDDNGMILGDVVRNGDEVRMYYVGFQLVKKVKFLAFSGLAISKDNGETFTKISKTPIMDRSDNAIYIRAIHSVLKENNRWKIWYSTGSEFANINGTPFPCYNVRYTESEDGINFTDKVGLPCLDVRENEYRLGRSRFIKIKDEDILFYTYSTKDRAYHAGIAKTKDGINWQRIDEEFYFKKSESGWDSKEICYPAPIVFGNKVYIFYTGNDYGLSGFGYAEATI